ncbi:MAG TPA: hypothetical protein VK420_16305 [Longimicrobium sp.]|nr:hypothetical protein [Longimicrobium sp.]
MSRDTSDRDATSLAAGTRRFADEDESVGNDGGTQAAASDGNGQSPAPGASAALALFEPVAPAGFLGAARELLRDTAGSTVYVIDVQASDESTLRAAIPGAAGAWFEIPAGAVETVTPLGIEGSGAERVIAAVAFRPGFESLAATFARLATGNAPSDSPALSARPAGALAASDDDPAAPEATELSEVADLATARTLANVGSGVGATEAFEVDFARPEAEAGPPTMAIDISRLHGFLKACTGANPRVTYGLGAKVPFLGAVPGKEFKRVDCSGFVREAIRLATDPRVPFPDGSVVQHEWVRAKGFRKSNVEAAHKKDGALRIAFLRPQDVKSGIGHVVLVHNALTLESHGGTGPNSRPWTGEGWQGKAFVYRLTDPAS